MKILLPIAVSAALGGCVDAGAIITGKVHTPIKATEVKLYSAPPAQFEDVAIITARSTGGWTTQGQLDSAVRNLKMKAAQLGANGVLIQSTGTQTTGAVAIPTPSGGAIMVPATAEQVAGHAIFVIQE